MSGVKYRRRKRWPGTRYQAFWLMMKRVYGGHKAAMKAVSDVVTRDWQDNLYDAFLMLKDPDTWDELICEPVLLNN